MAPGVAELLALARSARELEQHEAALLVLRRVRELDPKNLEAAAAIVELADQLERPAEAIEARLALVEQLIGAGKLERAAGVIDAILAVEPDHELALSFRDFVSERLNPEAAVVVAVSDDDEITAPIEVPDEVEEEWETRTTGVIAAGSLQELIDAEPPATPADDFEVPAHTIAVGGPGAAVALAEVIQSSPLLKTLDGMSCGQLLEHSVVTQCFAGQVIADEGAGGETMFLILEGEARVLRRGRVVETLGPGDFFGEAALLGKTPRIAALEMVGDGLVLEIERPLVQTLSARHRQLVDILAHVLRRRAILYRAAESAFLERLPKALLEEVEELFHLHKLDRGAPVPAGYWELVVGRVTSGDGLDLETGEGPGRASDATVAATSWLLELPADDLRKMLERYPPLRGALE